MIPDEPGAPTVQWLTDDYLIADQLREPDLARVAEAGVQTLINLRPDGEASDQPEAATLEAVARRLGLVYYHIPVAGGRPPETDIQAFGEVRRQGPGLVLGFCGSGTRAAVMWAYDMAPFRPVDELLEACADCGYQLDKLRPRLQRRQPDSTATSAE